MRLPVPKPTSIRDFYAFEQHVQTCRRQRGLDMVPQWYEVPVFYFSNAAAVVRMERASRRAARLPAAGLRAGARLHDRQARQGFASRRSRSGMTWPASRS